jgi:hypothetical protein
VVDQCFVTVQADPGGQLAGRHRGGARQHHDGLQDRRQIGRDGFDDRQEAGIGEDHAVLGMAGDVGDVCGGQPGIDGVADGADAGDGVIEFDMAVAVHG